MQKLNTRWICALAMIAGVLIIHSISGTVPSAFAANSEILNLKVAECGAERDIWLIDAKINAEVISDDVVIGEYTNTTDSKGDVELFIDNINIGDSVQITITPAGSPESYTHIHVLCYIDSDPNGLKRTGAWSLGSTGGNQMGTGPCNDQWWDEADAIFLLFAHND